MKDGDKTLTRQGFTKAVYLTPEALHEIMAKVEAGAIPGIACRQHGTSFTQFWARIKREPELLARYETVQAQRRQAELQSEHGNITPR